MISPCRMVVCQSIGIALEEERARDGGLIMRASCLSELKSYVGKSGPPTDIRFAMMAFECVMIMSVVEKLFGSLHRGREREWALF